MSSSSTGSPQVVEMPKLTTSNYAVWSPLMKNLLKMNLLWGIVQGRESTPLPRASSPQEIEHFYVRQDLATSQIFLNCDGEVQAKITDIDDPAELWRFLRDMSEKAAMVDEFWLRKRLYSVELGECGSVAAYVGLIQDTINRIDSCNPEEPVGPGQHCFVLCDGLPSEWLPFIGELHRAGKTSRKPEELIKLFLEHEIELNRGREGRERGEREQEEQREKEQREKEQREKEQREREQREREQREQREQREREQRRTEPVRQDPPPPPPPPEEPEPVRMILMRSRHRFYNMTDTAVNFYYTHPASSCHFRACYNIPAASVITNHLHVLYPELCRLIYVNDRRGGFINGTEQVGDVALYIKPTTGGDNNNNGEEGSANNSGSCSAAEEGTEAPPPVVESRKLIDWIFETPDWRQMLLDNFWEFPGGNFGQMYTLEVKYEESHRVAIFFDHEREFESLGVTLEMFFPPESDAEL